MAKMVATESAVQIFGGAGVKRNEVVEQAGQALRNILTILAEAGGEPQHIARLIWYVVDKQACLSSCKQLGVIYRELIGEHYPVMTAVEVNALLEDAALVEIEATAVIPE